MSHLAGRLVEEQGAKRVEKIAIDHADAPRWAERLKEAVTDIIGYSPIDIIETTTVISIHTDPGALALMYYTEEAALDE
ncbi:hypothetical protein GBL_3191 [Geobacillus kaustophilus GBlys]|uniref:Uncharacterized protein n=1 Tax=Geobacillus kaustophilus GBlys TaxID=1337888 RepID=U2Y6H0_GEOKU|nr:hypothetical protein GBL_3191 [Geobacillus kaustophilus GBlys]